MTGTQMMQKKKKEVISGTILIERDDVTREIEVEGIVSYHIELDYGSDADGNRGEKRFIIDEVECISAWDEDKVEDLELTKLETDTASSVIASNFLGG